MVLRKTQPGPASSGKPPSLTMSHPVRISSLTAAFFIPVLTLYLLMFYLTVFLSHCESSEDRHRGDLACPHDLVLNNWLYDKWPIHISDVWVGVFTWWVSKTPWIRSRFWILKPMLSVLVFSWRAPEAHSDYLTLHWQIVSWEHLCVDMFMSGDIFLSLDLLLTSTCSLSSCMDEVLDVENKGNTDKQRHLSYPWGA